MLMCASSYLEQHALLRLEGSLRNGVDERKTISKVTATCLWYSSERQAGGRTVSILRATARSAEWTQCRCKLRLQLGHSPRLQTMARVACFYFSHCRKIDLPPISDSMV